MSDLIGDTKDEVGKAPWDYFSWGHIAMGVMTFILLSLINTIPSLVSNEIIDIIPWWLMIVLAIVVALVWELLENTLFIHLGVKFEGRRDSLVNAIWDVIFAIIGALIMWLIKGILVNLIMQVPGIPYFYIVGLILFAVTIISFLIGRLITKD